MELNVRTAFLFTILLSFTLHIIPVACRTPPGPQCPPGQRGDKGEPGEPGDYAETGDIGEPAKKVPFPHGGKCECDGLPGLPGEMGEDGEPGKTGHPGAPGLNGEKGKQGKEGPAGSPGLPGGPILKYPRGSPGITFIPVVLNGKLPKTICQQSTKHAYVPNIPDKWLAWYRSGQSGYTIYNNWLYYTSKFTCPCSLPSVRLPVPPRMPGNMTTIPIIPPGGIRGIPIGPVG